MLGCQIWSEDRIRAGSSPWCDERFVAAAAGQSRGSAFGGSVRRSWMQLSDSLVTLGHATDAAECIC